MRSAWAVGAVLLGLFAASVTAQSVVRSDVDTAVVTVGDRVTLTISVEHALGAQARLPDSLSLAPFEVLEARALPVETTRAGARSTWRLTLAAFELGELEIPSVPVEVVTADGAVEMLGTDRFGIQVASVGIDESGELRDIRGPLGIPVGLWTILLWVLAPLLVAALLYVLVRRLRPRLEETTRPAIGELRRPPHEVALEALAALEASPLLERGQIKEYHITASDILRTYVEDRFRVEALEMTTREVLDGLTAVGANAEFRVGLRTFLEACDLVKFAKARPDAGTSRQALDLARRIILESVPSLAPATEAVPAAVGVPA